MASLFHLWAIIVPVSASMGIAWGGFWLFAAPLITLLIHPIADRLLPRIAHPVRLGGWASEALLLTYFGVQTTLLGWALAQVARLGALPSELGSRPITHAIQLGLCVGMMTGAQGITIAHELIHRSKRWQRALGVALLTQVLYGHFRIEHVYGHHHRVATAHDAASARPGETIYQFWPRSIVQSWVSAWQIETKRLRPVWKNRILHYGLAQLSWLTYAFWMAGVAGIAFWIIQALVAILLLELINYIEHYGLVREQRSDGRHEPVTAAHSWDSDHAATNAVLYNLGRHSDHHLHPRKACDQLTNPKGAPMLPWGYSTTMLLALIPSIYLPLMDERIRKATPQSSPTP